MELASTCRRAHTGSQFCCDRRAGPMVRIHFPPAGSQMRTRPRGFGNLPPCEPRARTASEISSSVRLALACGASVATPRHCAGGVPVDRVARARRSVTSASLI
jgi:hypothetical protein